MASSAPTRNGRIRVVNGHVADYHAGFRHTTHINLPPDIYPGGQTAPIYGEDSAEHTRATVRGLLHAHMATDKQAQAIAGTLREIKDDKEVEAMLVGLQGQVRLVENEVERRRLWREAEEQRTRELEERRRRQQQARDENERREREERARRDAELESLRREKAEREMEIARREEAPILAYEFRKVLPRVAPYHRQREVQVLVRDGLPTAVAQNLASRPKPGHRPVPNRPLFRMSSDVKAPNPYYLSEVLKKQQERREQGQKRRDAPVRTRSLSPKRQKIPSLQGKIKTEPSIKAESKIKTEDDSKTGDEKPLPSLAANPMRLLTRPVTLATGKADLQRTDAAVLEPEGYVSKVKKEEHES